jgi:hypothetical protein
MMVAVLPADEWLRVRRWVEGSGSARPSRAVRVRSLKQFVAGGQRQSRDRSYPYESNNAFDGDGSRAQATALQLSVAAGIDILNSSVWGRKYSPWVPRKARDEVGPLGPDSKDP